VNRGTQGEIEHEHPGNRQAKTNPEIMYVGFGELKMRRSVPLGGRMYKPADGGKPWQHLGLVEVRIV